MMICVYTLYICIGILYVYLCVSVSMCIQIIRALLYLDQHNTHDLFFAALFALPLCGRLAAARKNFLDFPPKSTHSVEIMPKLCAPALAALLYPKNKSDELSISQSLSSGVLSLTLALSVLHSDRVRALSLSLSWVARATSSRGRQGGGRGRR